MHDPAPPGGSAKNRPALWRRVLLIILDLRPPWYALASLWAIAGILLLLAAWVTAANTSSTVRASASFFWSLGADGTWRWNASAGGDRQVVEFGGVYTVSKGPGWRRITTKRFTSRVTKGLSVSPISDELLHGFAHDGWQRSIDATGGRWSDPTAAYELLRDDKRTRIDGWTYYLHLACLYAGLVILLAAIAVGHVRRLLRHGYTDRIKLAASDHCPRCNYTLASLPICPECGLNIARDAELTRRELARPNPR